MAKDKKSVLLYCDLITTVEELDDVDAGLLFKHYLRYINDQNPEAPSKLIKIVFEPIKQSLKRDLKKWQEKAENRSIAGKAGAEARWQKMAKDGKRIDEMAKMPVSVNVKDSVTVNDREIEVFGTLPQKFFTVKSKYLHEKPCRVHQDGFRQYCEKHLLGTWFKRDYMAELFWKENEGKMFNEHTHVNNVMLKINNSNG
ncbi:MAG: DUF6291 domain-containing protein [Betaproteobacteria bacterium]|jgi:hypothetical protein